MEILRAAVFHTPANPFDSASALVSLPDGALAIHAGRIAACDDFATLRARYPATTVRDLRGGFLLPGFIDTHIHFPQARITGSLGHSLLDWLRAVALPEEARLAHLPYAQALASEFADHLAAHGTTTSLVFGAHFAPAVAALFDAADRKGLRLISGLVLSDRLLLPELHQTPEAAYAACRQLAARVQGHARLRYAVTPRFALSAGEPMLDVCRTLLREAPGLYFTTHINENPQEVSDVARLFPRARDYFDVYEQFDLATRRSVFAHNVQATDDELRRFAARDCAVAHCPSSNAALGSGIFPLRRHLDARVRFALGTDVGAGAGFGLLREALQACLMQRVAEKPVTLRAAQLLYLATRAGAEALGMESLTGDFSPGKAADFVYLRPPAGSVLAGSLKNSDDPDRQLAAIITMAGPESIREVRVEGSVVFEAPAG